MTKRRTLSILASLAALLALLNATGCGSSSGGDYGGAHPDYAKALAGSPAPLAALHGQSDRLIGGGVPAFEKRIAALKGYPVVANVWASWCGPCRLEFPVLQRLSARYGKRVAFIGINVQDSDDAAKTFLAEAPVPYPSYTDPHREIVESLGNPLGQPDTAFYNRDGELLYLKQGQYADESELEADVKRYALESG
jgi:cytochrome c biogenesis protein CcmG/thiol:disulfide interchange protein DsbE